MNVTASPLELERTYEALRAQAFGAIPAVAPRGLAVLRRAGMVAWMRACPPLAPVSPPERHGLVGPGMPLAGLGGELVSLLTEMALGAGRRWCGES